MTNDILRADGESIRTYFPSFAEHAHENDPVFEDYHLTQIGKKIVKNAYCLVCKHMRSSRPTQDR